jgi:hypothetical protein
MTVGGLGRVIRRIYSGRVGGKILIVHGYCDGRERSSHNIPESHFFRLLPTPLHSGAMRPYLI